MTETQIIWALATVYRADTEAFDRTLHPGAMRYGEWWPAPWLMPESRRHARDEMERTVRRADRIGVHPAAVRVEVKAQDRARQGGPDERDVAEAERILAAVEPEPVTVTLRPEFWRLLDGDPMRED